MKASNSCKDLKFSSEKMFPSLEDRIPSKRNPAYPEYCASQGIDPDEEDPLILLSTIGRRGPSSFVFYPLFYYEITPKEILNFRKNLGLTTREFASAFEISQAALNALERGRSHGSEICKRLKMIVLFPDVALYFLTVNAGWLIHEKWVHAVDAIHRRQQK